jgi:Fur family iron response transcriptional regulator
MQIIPESRDGVNAKLRERGIKPTRQRVEVAHAIFSRCEHLSAERIFMLINAERPLASKATIYNTLNLFVEKGLVREVIADRNIMFYDPNTEAHHHFYNVETGELTDIDAREVQVSGLPPLPAGMTAEGIDIIVRVRAGNST